MVGVLTAALIASVSCTTVDPAPADPESSAPVVVESEGPLPSAEGPDPESEHDRSETTPAPISFPTFDIDLDWTIDLLGDLELDELADHDVLGGSGDRPEPAVTMDDLLELGVTQGVWAENDGVIALLEAVVGERDPASVPGIAQLDHHSITHLVEHAEDLVTGDLAPGLRARLEEVLARLQPDEDDPSVAIEPASFGLIEPASLVVPAAATPGVAPAEFSRSTCRRPASTNAPLVDPERTVSCWYRLDRSGQFKGLDFELRVFYPEHWALVDGRERASGDAPTVREQHAIAVLDALEATNRMGAEFTDRRVVADMDVWFAQRDLPTVDDSGRVFKNAALASASHPPGQPCRINVYPASFDPEWFDLDSLRFSAAHEAVHCLQHRAWGGGNPGPWVAEGGADFFASQVVPEHARDAFIDRFDLRSLVLPLQKLSYETAAFWQFLANEAEWSADRVWRLHDDLARGKLTLAEIPEMEDLFHRFVKLWVTTGVPDVNGNPMPRQPARVLKGDHIDRVGPLAVQIFEPFVAMRVRHSYEPERLITHRETGSPPATASFVLSSTARPAGGWSAELPEEVATPCDGPQYLLAVSTSTTQPVAEQRIVVSEVTVADCDLCVAGTWRLDNAHLGSVVFGLDGFDPDELFFDIRYEGEYLLRFQADGRLWARRTGWGVVVENDEYGGLVNVSDVIETARFGAVDGTLDITEHRIVDVRFPPDNPFGALPESVPSMIAGVSEVFGDLVGPVPAPTGSARLGYECDELELRFGATSGAAASMWSRWDRIDDRHLAADSID